MGVIDNISGRRRCVRAKLAPCPLSLKFDWIKKKKKEILQSRPLPGRYVNRESRIGNPGFSLRRRKISATLLLSLSRCL